jgi:hypothetical protein
MIRAKVERNCIHGTRKTVIEYATSGNYRDSKRDDLIQEMEK